MADETVAVVTDASSTESVEAESDLYCAQCGYHLRGITSDRCPECGLPIDHELTSRIPWVYRRHIGRVRAYLRTVRLATLNAKLLAAEVARPVSYSDAQRFRW